MTVPREALLRALALLKAGDRAEAMAALEGAEGDRQQAALALLRAGPGPRGAGGA